VSRLATTIQAIARHEAERRPACELGVVVGRFDNADGSAEKAHTVNVRLRESGVVVPNLPVAAAVGGAAGLPRPDDLVLVLFPAGDLTAGIVVGTVYGNERRPPQFGPDDLVLVWPGEAEDPDADAVRIRVGKDDAGRHVEVSLLGDKQAELTIGDGAITLKTAEASVSLQHGSSSDAKVTLKAGDASFELQQGGDVVLKTSGSLTLDADSIEIKGRSSIKVNGQTVEIN
jgi:phage baseplate assembly protein gpV